MARLSKDVCVVCTIYRNVHQVRSSGFHVSVFWTRFLNVVPVQTGPTEPVPTPTLNQSPLLEEVGRLKFEKSKVDMSQPLLGHIVEESDRPSGSKPIPLKELLKRSRTSGNTNKPDNGKGPSGTGRSIQEEQETRPRPKQIYLSEDDEDDTLTRSLSMIPARKRQKVNSPRRAPRKVYPSTVSSSKSCIIHKSPTPSTSRFSPSNAARPGAASHPRSDFEDEPRVGVSVLRMIEPELGEEGGCIEEEFEFLVSELSD